MIYFLDRPVTYLYNTLHYYERKLRDRPSLKRRLVSAVLGSLREIRPPGWALSNAYQMYMTRPADDAITWIPELDYYIRLVQRIVESKTTKLLRNITFIIIVYILFVTIVESPPPPTHTHTQISKHNFLSSHNLINLNLFG